MKKKDSVLLRKVFVLLVCFALVGPAIGFAQNIEEESPQGGKEQDEVGIDKESKDGKEGEAAGDPGTEDGEETGEEEGGGIGEGDAAVLDVAGAIQKALAFLNEQPDSPDRVMALAAAGQSVDVSFLKSFSGNTAIEYAKPILAVTAAEQDPRSYPNEDWVAKMKSFADNTQIGDSSLVNDDIWAILALMSAGVPANDPIIQNSKAFIMASQNADGGWAWNIGGDSDTNDTAAAIMALLGIGVSQNDTAIQGAISYLKLAQNEDGGFPYDPNSPWGTDSDGNSDAWMIMAINALGESALSWTKNGKNPIHHLLSLQDEDGGFWWMAPPADFNNKGATADAVIALMGKHFPIRAIPLFQEPIVVQEEGNTPSTASTGAQIFSEAPAEKTEEIALAQIAQDVELIAGQVAQLQDQVNRIVLARLADSVQQQFSAVPASIQETEALETQSIEIAQETVESFSSVFSEEFSGAPLRAEVADTEFAELLKENSLLAAVLLGVSALAAFGIYRLGVISRAKRKF